MDDLLLVNGQVITMGDTGAVETRDKTAGRMTALAISDQRIVWVGDDSGARERKARTVVDLKGMTVLPAFIDTHVHLTSTGFDLAGPPLGQARSIEQALEMIARAARDLPPGALLWCGGLDPSTIPERRLPFRDELDRAVADRIVWVSHAEYHAGSGNTRCLEFLGLEGPNPVEINGVDRELLTSRPTGILLAEANGLARRRMGDLITDDQRREALRSVALAAVSRGVVTVHAMEGGALFHDRDVEVLLRVGGELPVDPVIYWQTLDIEKVRRAGLPRIGGCVPLDGSTGTHTGAMIEPYTDAPDTCGLTYLSQQELDDWVVGSHRAGLQVSMHAGGDRSIDMMLDAIGKALENYPRADHRHRIEHFEVPQPWQFERAARLGVALAMQPAFDYFWGRHGGDYHITLGEERWQRTNALGSALRRGALVGGGSDAGVTPLDPLLGVHAAVNHHRPEERLSVRQAVELFTVKAAKLAFQENDRGSLEPGKRADMVILSESPFEVPPEQIKNLEIVATIKAGQAVYGESRIG